MKIAIIGANMLESQANAQVREAIQAGWASIVGAENVISLSLNIAKQAILDYQPNIVLCCGSYLPESSYYTQLSSAANRIDATCLFWATEDPYEIDASYRLSGHFHCIYTCDKSAVPYISVSEPCEHLPLAGSRDLHYRKLNPYDFRDIDIFFCGVAFNNRKQFIRSIMPTIERHKSYIVGPGWGELGTPGSKAYFSDDRISKDALINLYTRSKIVLNLGRDLNFENMRYMVRPSTPGPRTFEAALAGTCQLLHDDSCEIAECFLKDEMFTFGSPSECMSLIQQLSQNPSECELVAARAQSRALNNHTYEQRVQPMLQFHENRVRK